MNIEPKAAQLSQAEAEFDFSPDVPSAPSNAPANTEPSLPKTALVFESSDSVESLTEEEPSVEAELEDNSDIFAIADSSSPANKGRNTEQVQAEPKIAAEPEKTAASDEFIIPDVFDIADSDRNVDAGDYVSTIWKSYVPRFTEVTNNKYYFANNSVLEENGKAAKEAKPGEGDEDLSVPIRPSSGIRVEQRSAETVSDVSDPTAEVESAVPEVVVVKINAKVKTGKKDKINVFKFSEPSGEVEEESISDEERERQRLSILTGKNFDELVSEKPEEVSPEQNSAADAFDDASAKSPSDDEPADDSEPYYPYEPAGFNSKVVDGDDPFAAEGGLLHSRASVPEGYVPSSGKTAANDTTEYNSFSMRDVFKDKFLDSIMAVRIRLCVAIILGVLSLGLNIFWDAIVTAIGFVVSPALAAVIDAALIVAMTVICMPEIIFAIRGAVKGKAFPELSVLLMGISLLGYDIAVALSTKTANYPTFACVYAIAVINAVYATNCLHFSNFSAFKIVSEKGNKQIIDKPLTRNLELENSALDGAVDEYKSRCANLYTTPFVSGFFANSSKNAENSRNNLIILCSSVGAALVSFVVMLFLSGIAAALAAFALVVSLSVPAFASLTHKVVYADAQRDATATGSAIVGEAALADYAGVDVVCFEDTEVFGPDDVSLKSASDRRSDYLDSMRKMASLFAAIGGPLSVVFESAINKKCAPASEVVIEDDGIEGLVEGKKVMAGSRDYMLRHGVRIPNVTDNRVGSTRVIYAASEGEFFANFTVHYSFSEEFAYILSEMKENGMVPLVYTRDFNINNELMSLLTGGSDIIRVMREYEPVRPRPVFGKINASMVTFGDKTTALKLLLSSKRYNRFKDVISVIELASCLTGAALAAAIAVCNMMSALPVAVVAVWQIGWSIALRIMSKKNFNPRKKDKKNAEQ